MSETPPDPLFAITPAQFRERRLALGLTTLEVAERAGIGARDLLRFEEAGGVLNEAQRIALFHALMQAEAPPPPRPRAILDFGLPGTIAFFVVAAFPLVGALASLGPAVRILGADVVDAEVVRLEPGTAESRDHLDRSLTIATVAPIVRFFSPDGTGEVTITLGPISEDLNRLGEGDRLRLYIPPGRPQEAERWFLDALLRPLMLVLMALPMLVCGWISLGHWRRRRAR
jgi:transcriptional regulator with XRE-family HTH domain